MSRWLILVSVLGMMAAPQLTVAAQSGTPVPTLVVAKRLDLAALTLRPSDLESVGLSGFGLANQSSLRDAEADAFLQAGGDPLEAAERLAAYEEAQFQYRYVGSMLRPKVPLVRLPSGLVAAEQRITTAVSRYATSFGAAAGFAFTEGDHDDRRGRDVPGTRTFGDESELTRSRATDPETGERLRQLELTFRAGNLVAEVTIIDYAGAEPEVATVERLAELLLARIEQDIMLGPGLSPRILRLTPLTTWVERGRLRDFYTRIDRVEEPTFGQIATAIREGRGTPIPSKAPEGSVLPQDTYMYWTPIGEGEPLDIPLYVTWLDRFESHQQGSAALAAVTTDLGPGYTNVRELAQIAEPIGDESRTFAYHFEGDPAAPVRGYVVVARVGDVIVRVQADGPIGVQRAGVAALAERQVACAHALQLCAPLPMADASSWLEPGVLNSEGSRIEMPQIPPPGEGVPGVDIPIADIPDADVPDVTPAIAVVGEIPDEESPAMTVALLPADADAVATPVDLVTGEQAAGEGLGGISLDMLPSAGVGTLASPGAAGPVLLAASALAALAALGVRHLSQRRSLPFVTSSTKGTLNVRRARPDRSQDCGQARRNSVGQTSDTTRL